MVWRGRQRCPAAAGPASERRRISGGRFGIAPAGALLGIGVTLLSFAGEQLIGLGVPSARPRRRPPPREHPGSLLDRPDDRPGRFRVELENS
jgi:hypothetical protein